EWQLATAAVALGAALRLGVLAQDRLRALAFLLGHERTLAQQSDGALCSRRWFRKRSSSGPKPASYPLNQAGSSSTSVRRGGSTAAGAASPRRSPAGATTTARRCSRSSVSSSLSSKPPSRCRCT